MKSASVPERVKVEVLSVAETVKRTKLKNYSVISEMNVKFEIDFKSEMEFVYHN